jgi:hypothetical protein
MITYAEKIKELVETTGLKLKAYKRYAVHLNNMRERGENPSLEEQSDLDDLFMEFQEAMRNYTRLLTRVTNSKIMFDEIYEPEKGE